MDEHVEKDPLGVYLTALEDEKAGYERAKADGRVAEVQAEIERVKKERSAAKAKADKATAS
jgi:hypothetical protein